VINVRLVTVEIQLVGSHVEHAGVCGEFMAVLSECLERHAQYQNRQAHEHTQWIFYESHKIPQNSHDLKPIVQPESNGPCRIGHKDCSVAA
jgi:hypothetical protein